MTESFRYVNTGLTCHGITDNAPLCPRCKSTDVTEQGYDRNHRHHCNRCNITYWLVLR